MMSSMQRFAALSAFVTLSAVILADGGSVKKLGPGCGKPETKLWINVSGEDDDDDNIKLMVDVRKDGAKDAKVYVFVSPPTNKVTKLFDCPVYLDLRHTKPLFFGKANKKGTFWAKTTFKLPKGMKKASLNMQALVWEPRGDCLSPGYRITLEDDD